MVKIEEFTKEDFEGNPRFIPLKPEILEGNCNYIFDTEKLEYCGFSHLYCDLEECERVCDILNGVDYLLKEEKR